MLLSIKSTQISINLKQKVSYIRLKNLQLLVDSLENEMMYNDKLAAAIRVNGDVLREHGDAVYLPFGTEYELYFKNMHSQKAVANIEIDGEDILGGSGIIIDAFGTATIERFIKNGDISKGRKLKFIEKIKEISEHRGDRIEDGLIQIKYQFEYRRPVVQTYINQPNILYRSRSMFDTSGISKGVGNFGSVATSCYNSSSQSSDSSPMFGAVAEAGLTVEGSESNQSFSHGHIGTLEDQEHSMVIRLLGGKDTKLVSKIITTKTKIVCSSCGKKNKSLNDYCSRCGTYIGL